MLSKCQQSYVSCIVKRGKHSSTENQYHRCPMAAGAPWVPATVPFHSKGTVRAASYPMLYALKNIVDSRLSFSYHPDYTIVLWPHGTPAHTIILTEPNR